MIIVGNLLIRRENKFLLVREKKKLWKLPGGKMDPGETIAQCVAREIKEELSVTISCLKFLFCCTRNVPKEEKKVVALVFQGDLKGSVKPASEIDEIQWFSMDELNEEECTPLTWGIIRFAGL